MSKRSAENVRGFEFDWLACDADGNVGFFSTAGGGYSPEELLQDADAHHDAAESILALPGRTTARCSLELSPGLRNTWRRMAERGIFAYDSDPNGGPYERVASPAVPIHVSDLPEAVATVVRRITCRDLSFSELQEVSESLLLKRERSP